MRPSFKQKNNRARSEKHDEKFLNNEKRKEENAS